MNEGLGKVLRYGAFSPDVVERLKWMETVLYPTLKKAIEYTGKIDLKNIIAQALSMGDEVHNRNRAATSLLYRTLAPAIIQTTAEKDTAASVLEFINKNDHFFLNLSMGAAKISLDAARNIKCSSIVVVMARNGTDFGVQLSGTGGTWFTGESPVPDALYFTGYTKEDANPDIGDSSITETAGLGGFAIAASPAIVQFVGGSTKDAINYTLKMYEITAGENNIYKIPYLNFRGTPTGIDAIKVAEKNVLPFIDTGVAHKKAGIGQIGAGVLSAPADPFKNAVIGLANQLHSEKETKK
jgi:VanZ family protein